MSKTSKDSTTQNIDPQLREEADITMDSARMLAAMGYTPYTGNTIAGFTPAQEKSFEMQDAAASAFGMDGSAAGGVPKGTEGAYGIIGYSPETVAQSESPLTSETEQALADFYKRAGTQATDRGPLRPSGGKK